jgi:YD repeat-containing protein
MRTRIVVLLVLFLAATAAAQDHPNLGRGFVADKLYDFLGLETVNDFNGNLIIRLPIGQEFVSNGLLKYRFALTYNSSIWEYQYSPDGTQLSATPTLVSNAGAGWRFSLGSLLPPIGDPDNAANPGNNTGNWAYCDSAAARHGFNTTLHDGDTGDTYHWYTRDSTYIRMTQVDAGTRTVEFPDGTRQVFKKHQVPNGIGTWIQTWQGTKWRLASIEDGFGNRVTVTYETTSDANHYYPEVWHVQDGDRHHDVYFVSASTYYDTVLDHVVLNSTGGAASATFSMQYRDLTAQVTGAGDNSVLTRTFPVLVSVTLPDLTSYSMIVGNTPQYDTGTTTGTPGVITNLQLPTTGNISWSYDQFDMEEGTWNVALGGPKPLPPAVYQRSLSDAAGTHGTWTYNRFPSNGGLTCTCQQNPYGCPAHVRQLTTWTTRPDGSASIQYFSIYRSGDGCPAGVWSSADYGTPGTPQTTSGNGRLSSEFRSSFSAPPAGWTGLGGFSAPTSADLLWAREFSRYEGESAVFGNVTKSNLRPFYFKTTYDGDTDCSGCFTESTMSSFDNWGHYRQKSINSNVPGTPYRTTFTNFPGTLDGNGDWMLSAPTETCVADEASARTTTITQCSDLDGFTTAFNYDRAKGVELGRRVLGGAFASATQHDLLLMRTFDTKGNVTNEQFWGGDNQTLTNTNPLFSESQTPAYEIRHYPTYSLAGTLTGRHSTYRNVPGTGDFAANLEDVALSPYTGAVTTSHDPAGIQTTYDYDNMGRLTTVTPTGLAATGIAYSPASLSGSTFTPATATVATTSGTSGAIEKIYRYDAFGRLSFERALMPDGSWSRILRNYNDNGQVASMTTQQAEGSGCWSSPNGCPSTSYLYDAGGQARLVTAPDGSTRTVTRYAAARADTTVKNATGVTNLTRTETHDALGHLHTVTEKSGPTSASQTTGSDVVTTYLYDAQDRLSTVNVAGPTNPQPRSWAHDRRGLLTSESHPESDSSTFYDSYDARGHAWHRTAGGSNSAFDLTYAYDGAERLTFVYDLDASRNRRTLKQFVFSDANNGTNYSRGKLASAIRVNHLTVGDVAVTENYTYGITGGALSQKDTVVTLAGSPFQTFTQTYSYNDLGEPTGTSYPVCATATPCAATGGIGTLSKSFVNGHLAEVGTGVAGSSTAYGTITYSSNGTVYEVTHPQNVVDTYTPDSTGLARPTTIRFHGFTTCPSVTVTPGASSMCAGTSGTASATVISSATYAWTIDNGTITSAANTSSVTFTAGSGGSTTTLHVTVTSGGCTVNSSATVSVTSSVTITQQPTASPSSVSPNSTSYVSVGATGPSLTYQWYRGQRSDTTSPVPGANGSAFTTPSLTVTTTYWVRIGSSCGSVDSNTVTVVVAIPAPASVSAMTQTTTTQVLVQWSAVSTASSYIVEWAANVQSTFTQLPATSGLSALHTVTAGSLPVAYVYRVRSVDSAGNPSSAVSSIDYAVTGSPLFTNEPIQTQITRIYARHIGELRKAIDALRAAATTAQNPLPPVWQNAADPTGPISASAITSLFTPFNAARHVFGYGDFAYTGGIPVPQSGGRAVSEHLRQIRDALR